jgi:hypothetical protein
VYAPYYSILRLGEQLSDPKDFCPLDKQVFYCCMSNSCKSGIMKVSYSLFLDAFAKLRNATIILVMSVRPSVRMERLGSHWTHFHESSYLSIFRKSVEKIQVLTRKTVLHMKTNLHV